MFSIRYIISKPFINNILVQSPRCHSSISKPLFTYIGQHTRKDQISILDEFGSITYAELNSKSNNVAKVLQNELGIFCNPWKQHTVSLLCGNNSTYCNALFGIWKSGNIVVPLCTTHPASSLEYCIRDSESKAIITTRSFVDKIQNIANRNNVKLFLLDDMLAVNVSSNNGAIFTQLVEQNSYDVLNQDALILYTSGTTGFPKGVVHTHNSVISQINTMLGPWKWDENDCILHILPLHHTHGLVNCLLCPLAVGAKVMMLPKFDSGMVWKVLLSQGKYNMSDVNVFMAVPPVYANLIEYYHRNQSCFSNIDVKRTLVKNIRLMVSGSAALPNKILNEWYLISGHMLLERYGMTEIGMAFGNPYNPSFRIPGFVGNPLPGVEVRIVESGTSNVLVTGNQEGTIVNDKTYLDLSGDLQIKGSTVFKNYFNKAEATKKEFTVDGWFATGDIAEYVVSKDAYRIVGRSSVDIIKSGGYKVGALEVERILFEHPSIKDVAVVGVDDPTWGQRVGAVIVLKITLLIHWMYIV